MKLVLLKDITGIGKRGDLATVKDGYGLNYLVPQKLAATPGSPLANKVLSEMKHQEREVERKLSANQITAQTLDGQTFIINAKAGEGDKLYGSVTKADIADLINVDKYFIELEEPIKAVGRHSVIINFGHGVKCEIVIEVKST